MFSKNVIEFQEKLSFWKQLNDYFRFSQQTYVNLAIQSDTFQKILFPVSGISRNLTESCSTNLVRIPFNWILTFNFNFVKNIPFRHNPIVFDHMQAAKVH